MRRGRVRGEGPCEQLGPAKNSPCPIQTGPPSPLSPPPTRRRPPQVNREMAARLLAQQAEAEAAAGDGPAPKKARKAAEAVTAANPLADARFRALFEEEDFAIDEASKEYQLLHPNLDKVRAGRGGAGRQLCQGVGARGRGGGRPGRERGRAGRPVARPADPARPLRAPAPRAPNRSARRAARAGPADAAGRRAPCPPRPPPRRVPAGEARQAAAGGALRRAG
jgi:hypothetical protein